MADGPAYLQDVVGMDTTSHLVKIISAGYPERMPAIPNDALELMVRHQRLGQKSGIGFYRYEIDPGGKPRRSSAPDTRALLAHLSGDKLTDRTDGEIVGRMMLPMVIEAAHALEEGVVRTAAELDTALLLGIGFPVHLGGILKIADWLGLPHVVARPDASAALGPADAPTALMREMVARRATYY